MKPELVKKLKSPLKLNIEITGPTIGICDVPIKKSSISSKLLPIKHVNKIIEKAISFEILMFSFILCDFRHLLEPSVMDYLNLVCKRINRYGGLSALHIPVNLPYRNSTLKDFCSYIAKKIMELQIDIMLVFIPNRVLKTIGSEIGKLMFELALGGIQLVRLYTYFPSSVEEIERALIPSLKRIVEAASMWKAFNLVFIIDKKSRFNPQIIEYVETKEDIGNFTFSFSPTIPSCITHKFIKGSNLDIYKGICPGARISSTIGVDGFPIPCLHLRTYRLPEIDILWRSWGKIQNSWLLKSDICRSCEYETSCEGLCDIWKDQQKV